MPPFRRLYEKSKSTAGPHEKRKPFHTNRKAALEPKPQSVEDAPTPDLQEDDDDEGDEIPAKTPTPYQKLLQSLNAQSKSDKHRAKRQKLDDVPKTLTEVINRDPKAKEVPNELEAVEDPQDDLDEVINSDTEDHEDQEISSFKTHVEPDEEKLAAAIEDIKSEATASAKITFHDGWKAIVSGPSSCRARQTSTTTPSTVQLSAFKIKDKLQQRASKHFPHGLSDLTAALAEPIFHNQDVLFSGRTTQNAPALQQILCIHALDYVLKTRDRVLKNTARLAKAEDEEIPDVRDQGFTRPKVLFLLPTRQACYNIIDFLLSLYNPEQQENRKRFNESFSRKEDRASDDKPEDYSELFDGNDDDMFRVGIKFTRKTVKFFSQFYNSDMIFASPLGLKMALTQKDSKKEDYDFLSSIEIVIVDQAHAMLQQNWEHMQTVFAHLNLQPKESHGCDFSRVREWYLDGHARYVRQTIILSSYLPPLINCLAIKYMQNFEGTLRIRPETYNGSIVQFGLYIKQTFLRFEAPELVESPNDRFKAFTTIILPNITKEIDGIQGPHGILIFIPDYLDFPRIRNFMTRSDLSFASITEYTNTRDVARARSHFSTGRHSILLYTGRAHHFKRYKIKGVKKVVMYGVPDNPLFYTEVVDFIGRSIGEGVVASDEVNVTTSFCKWDALALERVVGSTRVRRMIREGAAERFDFQ